MWHCAYLLLMNQARSTDTGIKIKPLGAEILHYGIPQETKTVVLES